MHRILSYKWWRIEWKIGVGGVRVLPPYDTTHRYEAYFFHVSRLLKNEIMFLMNVETLQLKKLDLLAAQEHQLVCHEIVCVQILVMKVTMETGGEIMDHSQSPCALCIEIYFQRKSWFILVGQSLSGTNDILCRQI